MARTFCTLGDPAGAFGQLSVTVASLSPLSWQHIQDRSISHILEPETCKKCPTLLAYGRTLTFSYSTL